MNATDYVEGARYFVREGDVSYHRLLPGESTHAYISLSGDAVEEHTGAPGAIDACVKEGTAVEVSYEFAELLRTSEESASSRKIKEMRARPFLVQYTPRPKKTGRRKLRL